MKTKALSLFLVMALLVSLVPMTTLAAGLGLGTASGCKHEKTHNVQTITEATCTVDGNIHNALVCDDCGKEASATDLPIKAPGHKWSNGVCTACGEENPLQVAPKCQHEKTHNQQTITEATCTVNGNIHNALVCDDCGEEASATDLPIKAPGHKWSNGVCSVCGEKSPLQVAPKCQHEKTHTVQTITEASCTVDGNIHNALVCDDCGEEASATDHPIEAPGHKWSNGVCTVCGEKSPFQVAPKCQHTSTHTKQTITEATCTVDGNIHDAKVCNDCGEEASFKDYPIEAPGHKWADGACSACGIKKPVVIIPLCQHTSTHTKQTITEATCTVDGNIHHALVCNDCGKETSATDYPIEAPGHKWSNGVCTVCGEKSPFQVAPKCDHKGHGHSAANNGDGTHSVLCNKCKMVLRTEAHTFDDLHNCTCGAVKPFYVPEEEPVVPAPTYPADTWNRLDELFSTFK